MSHCHVIPTVSPSRGERALQALVRWFSRSATSREAIDQAWIDTGLGRLSRRTLEDIGAPPGAIELAERAQAWKLAAALDATRLL